MNAHNNKTDSLDLMSLLARRYPITLYPAEEGGYVAEIEDLPGCLTQGETIDEVAAAIEECRVAWIETASESGQDIPLPRTDAAYSGKLLLRIPKSLHRRLASRARQDGVSLNTTVATLLAASLEAREQQLNTRAIVEAILEVCESSQGAISQPTSGTYVVHHDRPDLGTQRSSRRTTEGWAVSEP